MLGKTNAVAEGSTTNNDIDLLLEGNIEDLVSDATQLNGYNFYYNSSPAYPVQRPKLKTVSLPNCTTIGYGAFYGCINLVSAYLPSVELIFASAFQGCNALQTINLPSLKSLGNTNIFSNCIALTEANFPLVTAITNQVFYRCYKLNKITLGANQVCALTSTSAFYNAGTQNSNPNHVIYIYVPSNLIEDYKVANNWSTLYNDGKVDFLAITD